MSGVGRLGLGAIVIRGSLSTSMGNSGYLERF